MSYLYKKRSFRWWKILAALAVGVGLFWSGALWGMNQRPAAAESEAKKPARSEASQRSADPVPTPVPQAASTPEAQATAQPGAKSFQLQVPFLPQTEDWPTGCESVSAVMALNYAGVGVSVAEFIENYLPLGNPPYEAGRGRRGGYYASDPREFFLGDPATEYGWGCWSPVILHAMEKLLADQGSSLEALDLEGYTLEELCQKWVAKGTPVLVWATIDMAEPEEDITFTIEDTREQFTWIYPLHCLVLTGWDEDHFYFNDPLEGQNVKYDRWACEVAYEYLGRQALAVE